MRGVLGARGAVGCVGGRWGLVGSGEGNVRRSRRREVYDDERVG